MLNATAKYFLSAPNAHGTGAREGIMCIYSPYSSSRQRSSRQVSSVSARSVSARQSQHPVLQLKDPLLHSLQPQRF
jgi:hypothetical protein